MLKQFNSNGRKLNKVVPKVNINNLTNTDLTGSLKNIEIPNNTKFQSKTKSNPNQTTLVNNTTKISNFYQDLILRGELKKFLVLGLSKLLKKK
jgi:hypothetical protein